VDQAALIQPDANGAGKFSTNHLPKASIQLVSSHNDGNPGAAFHLLRTCFMAQIILPAGRHALMQLAERIADGLERHASSLPLKDVDSAELSGALVQLRQAQTIFTSARTATALAASHLAADVKTLATWLGKARLALILAHGPRWSEAWRDAGFDNGATSVPKQLEARIRLAANVVNFFARKPEFGVPHADVTAMWGRKLHTNVVNRRHILYQLAIECEAARQVRYRAERRLRRRLRELMNLLSVGMPAKDPRWTDLGFKLTRSSRSTRLLPGSEFSSAAFVAAARSHVSMNAAVAA
jgi:hypothetical protein